MSHISSSEPAVEAATPATTARAPELAILLERLQSAGEGQLARQVRARLDHDLRAGRSLPEALERVQAVANRRDRRLLFLLVACRDPAAALLAWLREQRHSRERREHLWGALAYPVFLIAMAYVVTVAAYWWLVPPLAEVMSDGVVELGSFGGFQTIDTTGDLGFFALHFLLVRILVGVGIFCLAASLISYVTMGRQRLMRLMFHLPLIGPMFRSAGLIPWLSTFALLLETGDPIPRALNTLRRLCDDVWEAPTQQLAKKVEAGRTLASALAATPPFPPTLAAMLLRSEQPGSAARLPEELTTARELYAEAFRQRALLLRQLAFLAAMFWVVGTVLLMAALIFTPIINAIRLLSALS